MQICLQKHLRKKRLANIICLLLVAMSFVTVLCTMIYKTSGDGVSLAADSNSVLLLSAKSSSEVLPDKEKTSCKISEMNNFADNNAKSQDFPLKNEISLPSCKNILVLSGKSVRSMPVEEYVTGCVLGEMPLSFESQALMAQCVASRTFAVRQAGGFSKHKNADVCTNPACCQNFISPDEKNISRENLKKLTDAVNATKGIIILYDGEPIEAVYHASSGGKTLSSEQVWGGRVEYLRAVDSPKGEEALEVSVKGHRVGMSQHGANLLAKEGKCYTEILKYYYSGVSLGFLR